MKRCTSRQCEFYQCVLKKKKTLLIFYYFVFPTNFLLYKYYLYNQKYIFENMKEHKQGFRIRWNNELKLVRLIIMKIKIDCLNLFPMCIIGSWLKEGIQEKIEPDTSIV